jgi:hypothetical protein
VEHLELPSPLQVDVAEERLAAGLTLPRQRIPGRAAHGAVDILGRVHRRRVSVCALPSQVRMNSFSPYVRGRLEPVLPRGSRLVATIGWHPAVRVLTVFWSTFVACYVGGTATGVGVSLARGTGLGPAFPLLCAGLVMAAFGVGVTGYLGRRGWRDEKHLREWLRATLEAR